MGFKRVRYDRRIARCDRPRHGELSQRLLHLGEVRLRLGLTSQQFLSIFEDPAAEGTIAGIEGLPRFVVLQNPLFEISPAPDVDQHFTAACSKLAGYLARELVHVTIIRRRRDNVVFAQRRLKLERLLDLGADFLLGQDFSIALQLALDTDKLVEVAVTVAIEIDAILPLPASRIELNRGVLEQTTPKRQACSLEGLFVCWLGNLRCAKC